MTLNADTTSRGGRFQVHGIAKHLAHGLVQLSLAGLELPTKMIFVIGVGLAGFDAMLEGVGQAVEITERLGMADEVAEVVEPGLGALLLVQAGISPSCDEMFGHHVYILRPLPRR